MALHRRYEPATGPSQGPTPGAKALMSWFLAKYKNRRNPVPANLGIWVVKRLGSGWSLHAEGRAGDLGTKPYSRPPWGWTLANFLRRNSRELGVQLIIFDRKIWSGSFPDAGWRNYNGSEPHTGHLHVELSRDAARTLTAAKIERIWDGGTAPPPQPPPAGGHQPGTRYLKLANPMMRGADVAFVQRFIGPVRAGAADGIFGQKTQSGVKWYQNVRGLQADGIVGPRTWRNMGVNWHG